MTPRHPSAQAPAIVLFRRDLRLADNLALWAAAKSGRPTLPLFLLDDASAGLRPLGSAARWWLRRSLLALGERLGRRGTPLVLRRGAAVQTVLQVAEDIGAGAVFWNSRHAPSEAAVDAQMQAALAGRGIRAEGFEGELLHQPTRLTSGSGGSYKVHAAFWRAVLARLEPGDPIEAPDLPPFAPDVPSQELDLVLPPLRAPDWPPGLDERWTPGESAARERLQAFLAGPVLTYASQRDRPGETDGTSRLSPHLACGEITPRRILAALAPCDAPQMTDGAVKFRSELGWREFSYHLLAHNPRLHTDHYQPAFDRFPWRSDPAALDAWRKGRTGYPVVDAGMRELAATGFMHNRVRMVVASFLTRHLMIDWRHGEQWFWDRLVDADPANNPANWQWVAGTGADAAPYVRIFNPVLQGERLDPDGRYVRRHLPELAGLPDRFLHRPWEAPPAVLSDGGVTLGRSYPRPIVDHRAARERALRANAMLRGKA